MMKMQGNTTEIDERNLLRLDALLSHGYGLSPQLVIDPPPILPMMKVQATGKSPRE